MSTTIPGHHADEPRTYDAPEYAECYIRELKPLHACPDDAPIVRCERCSYEHHAACGCPLRYPRRSAQWLPCGCYQSRSDLIRGDTGEVYREGRWQTVQPCAEHTRRRVVRDERTDQSVRINPRWTGD